jgi:hypothetical protein
MHATPKLTAVTLVGALLLGACARNDVQPVVSASSPAAAAPIDPTHPRLGPATAAVGTPYPFDLFTHCGGEYATFAGRTWQTDDPPGNLTPRADATGTTRVTGYLYGTMTLVDRDRAKFVIDPAGVAEPPPGPVLFHPFGKPAPLCK